MADRNPAIALLLGKAMGKKENPLPEPDTSDEDKSEMSEEEDAKLQDIAENIIEAIKSEDASSLKDLLFAAFMCLESYPHKEAEEETEE